MRSERRRYVVAAALVGWSLAGAAAAPLPESPQSVFKDLFVAVQTAQIYADGKTFYHGHTYGGNPLGAAVALATLRVFDDEQTLANMVPKVDRLAAWLAEMAEHPLVGNVRQSGLIAGVECEMAWGLASTVHMLNRFERSLAVIDRENRDAVSAAVRGIHEPAGGIDRDGGRGIRSLKAFREG